VFFKILLKNYFILKYKLYYFHPLENYIKWKYIEHFYIRLKYTIGMESIINASQELTISIKYSDIFGTNKYKNKSNYKRGVLILIIIFLLLWF